MRHAFRIPITFIFVNIKTNRPSACSSFDIQHAAQQLSGLSGARLAQRIIDPLALLTRAHQAGVQQDAHMVGQRRLADIQRLLKTACTALPRLQKREDREAILISHRLKNTSHHLIGSFHVIPLQSMKYIDNNKYYTHQTGLCQSNCVHYNKI